jgi:hypothetical protein
MWPMISAAERAFSSHLYDSFCMSVGNALTAVAVLFISDSHVCVKKSLFVIFVIF